MLYAKCEIKFGGDVGNNCTYVDVVMTKLVWKLHKSIFLLVEIKNFADNVLGGKALFDFSGDTRC